MSVAAKVIILDRDEVAASHLAWTFARLGVPAHVLAWTASKADIAAVCDANTTWLLAGEAALAIQKLRDVRAVVSSATSEAARATYILIARGKVTDADLDVAGAAGATATLVHPLFARDIATLARIAMHPSVHGQLHDTSTVLRLVRALCSLRQSGVLTMMRGLRRGEIRIFKGEVTSAQVGMTHGQSALHQLLLWTDARFDFRREEVVKRGQIPLTNQDLFDEAERFLERMYGAAGGLRPSDKLERNEGKIAALGQDMPKSVAELLRIFDGNRTLADVLEDSPYRQFETLRVTLRAVEAGVLKQVSGESPKASWRAVLAIEEWLAGLDRKTAQERVLAIAADPESQKLSRKKKKKRRTQPVPQVVQPPKQISWGDLVPRESSIEIEAVSQVVPTSQAAGEIKVRDVAPTRDSTREGLEKALDSDARQRVFVDDLVGDALPPSDEPPVATGSGSAIPTVVIGDAAAVAAAPAVAESATNLASVQRDAADAQKQIQRQLSAQAAAPATPQAGDEAAVRHAKDVMKLGQDAKAASDAFTEEEQQFFDNAGRQHAPVVKAENFDDLDEGYQRQSFWDRLIGKKPGKSK